MAGRLSDSSAAPRGLIVFVWAALVGAVAGLLGAAFRIGVATVRSYTEHLPVWGEHIPSAPWMLSVVATAGLAALAVFVVRRFAPEGSGSGVHEIEGALEGVRALRWRRLIPAKFFGGLCSLGSGMVLGREGPTIQMGGAVGKMIAEWFRLPGRAVHILVAAGAGAGLTTAFNAPLAGVMFVIEEMRFQFQYSFTSVQSVVIACGVADVVLRALTGQGPVLHITEFADPPLASLWIFPILGAIFGFLGVVFNWLLVRSLDYFADGPRWMHRASGGLAGAAIGALAWYSPFAVGGGDELIPQLFTSSLMPLSLAALFLCRFGATMLSYGCGAPGGIFAPMLALGTIFGLWCGHYAHIWFPGWITHPGMLAVAGMGALFAATVRAPITGIALVVELTADYGQILPLLLTCAAATIAAELLGGRPIYTLLLERTLRREPAPTRRSPS